MYWLHVARKDFADAVRSKLFWGLSVVMILFAYLGLYVPIAIESDPTAETGLSLLTSLMLILVPMIALIVGYMAIVGERETGSIRMVLSLPLKRKEVLFGKFVGRSGVVLVPIVLGFLLAVPFVALLYGEFPVNAYGEFLTRVLLTGIIFVAVAIGISGSVSIRGKALAGVVSIFALFEWFWEAVPFGLYYLANGDLSGLESPPTWVQFLSQLPPGEAAGVVASGLFSLSISTADPLILQEWVAGLIVLLWIAFPLAIGYVRFDRANIS